MKKALRIVIALLLIVPAYPFLFATFSVVGIGLMAGIGYILSAIGRFLSDKKDDFGFTAKDDLKIAAMFLGLPLIGPIYIWYAFVVDGEFDLDMPKLNRYF